MGQRLCPLKGEKAITKKRDKALKRRKRKEEGVSVNYQNLKCTVEQP